MASSEERESSVERSYRQKAEHEAQMAREKALQQEYKDYVADIEAHPEWNLPVPTDFDDYLRIKNEAEAPPTEPAEPEYSDEDWHEYNLYQRYYSAFGDPADQRARSISEYFANQDSYLEQLTGFQGKEAEEIEERLAYEESQLSPEEAARRREESYQYTIEGRLRAEEARLHDLSPEEYARRREESYDYTVEARERAEEERLYELSPEEQARRREESYQYTEGARERSLYAAQEAYQPSPEYRSATEQWHGGLGSEPLGYQQWARQMFPTWESQYKSTQEPMVGYPTRELARAEEERRTAGLEGWLQAGQEGFKQQYYQQSPYERGERPGQFNPALRQLSFR